MLDREGSLLIQDFPPTTIEGLLNRDVLEVGEPGGAFLLPHPMVSMRHLNLRLEPVSLAKAPIHIATVKKNNETEVIGVVEKPLSTYPLYVFTRACAIDRFSDSIEGIVGDLNLPDLNDPTNIARAKRHALYLGPAWEELMSLYRPFHRILSQHFLEKPTIDANTTIYPTIRLKQKDADWKWNLEPLQPELTDHFQRRMVTVDEQLITENFSTLAGLLTIPYIHPDVKEQYKTQRSYQDSNKADEPSQAVDVKDIMKMGAVQSLIVYLQERDDLLKLPIVNSILEYQN